MNEKEGFNFIDENNLKRVTEEDSVECEQCSNCYLYDEEEEMIGFCIIHKFFMKGENLGVLSEVCKSFK